MRTISAAKAKAELLALLEQVRRTRQELVITKRGQPVARLAPLSSVRRSLAARLRLNGDVVAPVDERWNEG